MQGSVGLKCKLEFQIFEILTTVAGKKMSVLKNSSSTETYDVLEYSGERDLDPSQVHCFLTSLNEAENYIGVENPDKKLCRICELNFEGSNSRHRLLEHINSTHGFDIFEDGKTCYVCNSVVYSAKDFQIHKNYCRKETVLITSQLPDETDKQERETIKSNQQNVKNNVALNSNYDIVFTKEESTNSEHIDGSTDSKPEKCARKNVDNDFLKCYICSEIFRRTTELTLHVITYHKNEINAEDFDDLFYRCKKCSATYPNLILIREHFFKKHTALIIYRCVVCHITFRTKKSLRIHYKNFHALKNTALHSCEECGKKFSNLKAIKAHIRLKHGPTNKKQGFRCRLCQEKFDTKEKRKLHYEEEHLGESPFICTDCGKGFSSKSGLYGHRQLHKTDQPSACPYCEKIFNRRDSYHEHILIHVGPRHRCPHCPKEFVQRSNLVRHIRIHTGQKPYACTFCDKRFSDKGACNSHIRVHTKEEQCTCPHCGQTFTKKQKLKYHIRKHTGEGLISCEICSKTFTNAFALKEHRAIHNRQTQTICVECGKAFNSTKYLQRHVALVHQEPQVPNTTLYCPICRKTFRHQTRLKSHLVTHLGKKHLQCVICAKRYSSTKSIRNHLKQSHALTPDHQEYKKSIRSTFENTQVSINSIQLKGGSNAVINSEDTVVTFLFKRENKAVESNNTLGHVIENENNGLKLTNNFYNKQSVSCLLDNENKEEINYKDSTELEKPREPENEETYTANHKMNSKILNRCGGNISSHHENISEPLFNAAGKDIDENSSDLHAVCSINRELSSEQLESNLSAISSDREKVDDDAKKREILQSQVLEENVKSVSDLCKDISRRRKKLRTPKKYVSPIESLNKVDNNLTKIMPKRERVEAIARSLKESCNMKDIFD